MAHLCAWHGLIETWYIEGTTGKRPEMPAPGYSWKTTPQLNEKIYQDHKNESFDLVLENLRSSHLKTQGIIEKHTDEELFIKKLYHWAGSTSMGSYFISFTSSYYQWAFDLIKKWLKLESIASSVL